METPEKTEGFLFSGLGHPPQNILPHFIMLLFYLCALLTAGKKIVIFCGLNF